MVNVIGRDPKLQILIDAWRMERNAEVERIKRDYAGQTIFEMDQHLRIWERVHPLPIRA